MGVSVLMIMGFLLSYNIRILFNVKLRVVIIKLLW